MAEYFVVSTPLSSVHVSREGVSFDVTNTCYAKGESPDAVLSEFVERHNRDYRFRLYAAALFADANAYHKFQEPLLRWLSPELLK